MQDSFLKKDCNFVNFVKQEQLLGSFLSCHDSDGNENIKTAIGLDEKNSALAAHFPFCGIFLCSHCKTLPNFTLYLERELTTTNFSF